MRFPFDLSVCPNLLMEPFDSEDVFDDVDLTPGQFKDVGHTIVGGENVFAGGFESGKYDRLVEHLTLN